MSEIKVNSIKGAAASTAAITVHNTDGTATGKFTNLPGRNLIINGAQNIDQRGVSTEVTPVNDQYLTDRWNAHRAQASKFKVQKVTESPTGFTNSLKITSLSAYTSVAADYFALNQYIEGQDIYHLGWGAAGAKTVTLSFWVRGSVTGNYAVSLRNNGWNRAQVQSYTISSADTWEKKSVTFTGDTSGTWLTTNGRGIAVGFDLGFGSDYEASTGSWVATNDATFSGATKLVATNAATLYIAGVQLEVGDTATDFEYRSYGDELARCERYYQAVTNNTGMQAYIGTGFVYTSSIATVVYQFRTEMRDTPSLDQVTGSSYYTIYRDGNNDPFDGFTGVTGQSNRVTGIYNNSQISSTAGHACGFHTHHNSAWVALNAEL